MESTPSVASLGTFGDTLTVLSVPYEPNETPVYPIYNDGDTANTLPGATDRVSPSSAWISR